MHACRTRAGALVVAAAIAVASSVSAQPAPAPEAPAPDPAAPDPAAPDPAAPAPAPAPTIDPVADPALGPAAADDSAGEVIEISGAAPEPTEPETRELTPDVIRRVPGSGNDALKSLQTMPGVGRVPYGMGGLVLRGTSPRDSSVFLDGMEVPLLYHFGGLASFHPSSTLSSLELIPGGYSARYGRGQGGVVVLESRPGRADRWRVGAELSMIDLSATADGPSGGHGSWSIGVRRSVVDAVLPFVSTDVEVTAAPRYYDGQVRFDTRLWSGARLTAQLLGSDDEVGLIYGERLDKTFNYGTRFARFGARFQQDWERTSLSVAPWLGVDDSFLESTFQTMTSNRRPAGGRARLTRQHARGQVSAGVDVSAGAFDVESLTVDDNVPMAIAREGSYRNTALWTEGTIRLADGRLNVRPGLRLEHYSLSDEVTLDPRLVLTHELRGGVTLTESAGLYHQPPSPADSLWGNDHLDSSHAVQVTAGVAAPVGRGGRVSVTGFYSRLRNLAVDDPTAEDTALENFRESKIGALPSSREFMSAQFGTFSRLENIGSGDSIGVEVMARWVGARGFAWLAYTGSRARRRDSTLPDGEWQPYILDQPHVLTVLGSRKLGRSWQVGARLRYASGNPITPILGGTPIGDEEFAPIYGEPNSERLAAFVQLDLRVDRSWIRDWGTIHVFLDVQNVTRRGNVEGRIYEDDFSSFETTRGLPLFPSFGVSYTPAAE